MNGNASGLAPDRNGPAFRGIGDAEADALVAPRYRPALSCDLAVGVHLEDLRVHDVDSLAVGFSLTGLIEHFRANVTAHAPRGYGLAGDAGAAAGREQEGNRRPASWKITNL